MRRTEARIRAVGWVSIVCGLPMVLALPAVALLDLDHVTAAGAAWLAGLTALAFGRLSAGVGLLWHRNWARRVLLAISALRLAVTLGKSIEFVCLGSPRLDSMLFRCLLSCPLHLWIVVVLSRRDVGALLAGGEQERVAF